jgi:hypothetical protein
MNYKKSKMGQVPGDVSRWTKIKMLEDQTPIRVTPWHTITEKCAKSFKKDHIKKANRRFRHNKKIDE